MKISEEKKILKNAHVPRITQLKHYVPRSKSVLSSSHTDGQTDKTHTHESENRGHPFRVSGIFPSTYH